ncbi:unnamed protein product [Acanthoscelides obtectus]|uniref:DUF659 domain-containing protein n=1 Tax=Acanthoscelides obtectus TaxID=200917 RepID=A0A9P0KYD9_ACAOB|nr:unnamed protein product [Acanthoscelides obtectus]CAK1662997.1 hypothetical protein AOBTE_LOCUS23418 [Acanthoscelides obtectus]
MTNHILNQCSKCPLEIKQKYCNEIQSNSKSSTSEEKESNKDILLEALEDTSLPSTSKKDTSSMSSSSESSLPSVKRKKASCQQTLSGFFDKTAVSESSNIDEALARALYASGAPFSLFKNKYWEQVFKMLRPSYQIPSPYALSTNLLNSEYERGQINRSQKLSEFDSLSIVINIVGDGLINIVICTPIPLFYKTVHRGTVKETGTYISNELIKVIQEIEPQKFFLIVTDSASNMKAAWNIINTTYPHTPCVGCAAHTQNLLLKDFMKENLFEKISKESKKICKCFKQHHILYAVFKEAQAEKYPKSKVISLKLPAKTRWGSLFITLDSLLRNKEALQCTVLVKNLNVKQNIKKVVLDDAFWQNLQYTKQILYPISKSVNLEESDRSILSEVPFVFKYSYIKDTILDIPQQVDLTSSLIEGLLKCVEERYEFCFKPIHFAANILDARFKGEQLNKDQLIEAIDFISEMVRSLNLDVGKVVANLAQFRTKTGFFSRNSLWDSANSTHPVIW